jgi:hypothetical protein
MAQEPPSSKKVDESWKEAVRKEKKLFHEPGSQPARGEPGVELPEAGFGFLVSTLGMQAMQALEAKPKADLGHTKYLIDTLEILAAKTKGNLTAEEEEVLTGLLYELRVKFVEKSQNSQ